MKSAMSLQDATRMLTTEGILFDAKQRVNRALDGAAARSAAIGSPLGPPLNFDVEGISIGVTNNGGRVTPPRVISPPALPPGVAEPSPPGFGTSANSPPAGPPSGRQSGVRFSAPPFDGQSNAPSSVAAEGTALSTNDVSAGKVSSSLSTPTIASPVGPLFS